MPWILSLLAGFASRAFLFAVLKRAAIVLGLTAVSFLGFNGLWQAARTWVISSWGQLPGDLLTILHIASFDRAISLILSAYAARLAMMGLTSAGVLKKVLWKPGQQGSLF